MNPFVKLKLMRMSPEEAYQVGDQLYYSNQERKAFPYFLYAAKNGYGYAQHMAAVCYSKGHGCAPDPKQAQYWYERAAEHGYPKSQYLCAQSYDFGQGCTYDKEKALYWYEKAAEQAKPNHLYGAISVSACAIAYEQGRGCAVNLEKALYWYEKCRDLHLQDAEELEKKNSLEAKRMARELAVKVHEDVNRVRSALGLDPEPFPLMEHETPAAIVNAEQLLAEGKACLVREPEKACDLLRQAAELQNPEAQFQYGQLLRFGKGCQEDINNALRMLEKAADQGHVLAQRHLGMLYFHGLECRKNRKAAQIWLKKAADQNDPDALYHMGLLDIHRLGRYQDDNQAEFYLKQAVAQGHAQAQEKLDLINGAYHGDPEASYRLAMLIIEVGDRQDWRNQARPWLRRAVQKGHESARQALNTVAKNFPN